MKDTNRKTTKKDKFKSMYMKDQPAPYEGETPEMTIKALSREYSEWFAGRYGRMVSKTAWHFFAFVYSQYGNPLEMTADGINALVLEFRRACAAAKAPAKWNNAIRWWILDEEGLV